MSGLVDVNLWGITIPEYIEALTIAFGHVSNVDELNEYSTKGGDYGLGIFISDILTPLLDSLPLDDVRYKGLYNATEMVCGALASKLTAFYAEVKYSFYTCASALVVSLTLTHTSSQKENIVPDVESDRFTFAGDDHKPEEEHAEVNTSVGLFEPPRR